MRTREGRRYGGREAEMRDDGGMEAGGREREGDREGERGGREGGREGGVTTHLCVVPST